LCKETSKEDAGSRQQTWTLKRQRHCVNQMVMVQKSRYRIWN